MIKVNVGVSEKNWKKYIKKPDAYIAKRIKKINDTNIFFKNKIVDFSLMLSGNNEIKSLNKKFRKKNKTTDILSFPFYERKALNTLLKEKKTEIYLGDIIINLNKMISKTNEKDFLLNFDKIWIHGLAHLFGYRHKSNIDFSIMKKIETKLIKHSK